ncbi:MAG TPA: DUF3575 domain-containing protein [Longimicrobium sp.]|nr:DUF3575 domain-containing protein [Longimicrobium sp.]
MFKRFSLTLTALGLALSSSAAAAQESPRQVLSINPIGAVFGVYMGEFERSVGRHTSVGVAGTYWDTGFTDSESSGELSYTTVDARLRYYPGESRLQGFSIGGSLGYTGLSGELTTVDGEDTGRLNTLGAGIELDYNWLLGARNQVMVGTGIGAKRLFILDEDIDDDDVTLAYPTLRLVVGYAF